MANAQENNVPASTNSTWPSALVAIGLLALIGAISVSAIRKYPTPEEALKVWAALGVLIGVVTGAFVAYFFTKDQVKQANEQLGEAKQQVVQANEQVTQANQLTAQKDQMVVQANEQVAQANQLTAQKDQLVVQSTEAAAQARERADMEAENAARATQAGKQMLAQLDDKTRTKILEDQEMAALFA